MPNLEDLSYEEIEQLIRDLPMTWIPALLQLMVETAIKKGVFIKGRINVFVKQVEDKAK